MSIRFRHLVRFLAIPFPAEFWLAEIETAGELAHTKNIEPARHNRLFHR